jgi:hypothetical protein
MCVCVFRIFFEQLIVIQMVLKFLANIEAKIIKKLDTEP